VKHVSVRSRLTLCIRIALGIIFLIAGFEKILHPEGFALVIQNYQILPQVLVNPTALILPWIEVLLGLSLMMKVLFPGAVALTNMILAVFLGALLFNLARGLEVECGCFSTELKGNPNTAGQPRPGYGISSHVSVASL
jgi:uncharacterized membrane protein YphA (DoxX/SURF4 family)